MQKWLHVQFNGFNPFPNNAPPIEKFALTCADGNLMTLPSPARLAIYVEIELRWKMYHDQNTKYISEKGSQWFEFNWTALENESAKEVSLSYLLLVMNWFVILN